MRKLRDHGQHPTVGDQAGVRPQLDGFAVLCSSSCTDLVRGSSSSSSSSSSYTMSTPYRLKGW
jgi:hypothetical protein